MLIVVYPNDQNVASARYPRNSRNWQGNRDMKCRPAWNARRAAYLEVVTNPERLITGGTGNQQWVPIFIVDRKFYVVSLIAFIPLDLDEPGDRKWLQPRADLRPRATPTRRGGIL